MKTMSKFSLVSSLVLLLVLASCSLAMAAKQVELVVWDLQSYANQPWYQNAIKAFTEKYPHIKLEFEPHEGVPAEPKFISAIRTGNAPDVGILNLYWVKDFAMNGWIQPLDPVIEPETRADFFDGFLEYASYEGQLYGLFNETGVATVLYRKDLLAEAGITPPALLEAWDFDEFAEAAKKLTKDVNGDGKIDVWGVGIAGSRTGGGGPATFVQFPFFWALGGELIDENGWPAINSEAGRGSLQFYHDLVYKHGVAPQESYSYTWDDIARGFSAGQYAMAFLHNTHAPSLEQQFPGQIGAMLYPVPEHGVTSATTAGGWIYSIFTDDPDKQQAAWDYVSWMLSPEVMRAMCVEIGGLPTRRSVFDDPIFASELFQVFGRQLEGAHMKPGDPIFPVIQDEFGVAIQEVLMNQKDPATALEDAERNVIQRGQATGILK
ncbi:MAG: ABC transporter substrate-binding protein [Limnochordia bacterium]